MRLDAERPELRVDIASVRQSMLCHQAVATEMLLMCFSTTMALTTQSAT